MRDATQFPVVERDFARMHQLEDELEVEAGLEYYYSPTEEQKTKLMFQPQLSLDLETAGDVKDPDGVGSRITHMSVSPRATESYLLRPGDPMYYELLDHPYIIGQNWLQYDAWWVWRQHGQKFKTLWDTRLGGHLLNPDTPNNLVYLSREFATPPARGYWKTQEDYKERKDHVALVDADVAYRVRDGQYDRMVDRGILDIMENHIIPLCNVVFDMRAAGMRLDTSKLDQAVEVMGHDLLEERNRLPEWPATAHGWRSENQNAHVHNHLYTTLGLPPQYKRGEAKLTADKDALKTLVERIELDHHTVSHLSEVTKDEALTFIRRLQGLSVKSKLESTFRKYRDRKTEWVHPILNPSGTGTFRFSSNDPNVQQVSKCKCKPKCNGENPDCRGARHIFLPDEDDWLVVRFDLKQAEVVTFLWYVEAWDVLDQVLNHGHDVHQLVADKMTEVTGVQWDRDTQAKTTTFATLYGESPETTAARNQLSVADVEDMRTAYFKAMPGVQPFRDKYIGHAMSNGYIETPFRTRRYIRVSYPIGRAANQAGNAPVQAVPPWILRRAMIDLHRELPKPARLWNQVHDEIDIVTPPDKLDAVLELGKYYITAPIPEMPASAIGMHSGLRFATDVEIGPHWGALVKEEKFKCTTV
jgi:DNA polymerase I-like protein with 3'-5' exonuclease and polymerase domains